MKNRKSNFEILRIISIVLIIFSHFSFHGGFIKTSGISFNNFILDISVLGNLGVMIFVIITGYFSSKKDMKSNFKKIIKLFLQILFYSIILYLIVSIINKQFILGDFIKTLFPIISNEYWFMTKFILLLLLSPYINLLIKNLQKKEYQKLLALLTILIVIIPTFTALNYFEDRMFQFIYLYLIGGYINLYVEDNNKKDKYLLIFVSSLLIAFLSTIVLEFLNIYPIYFMGNNIFMYICAVAIFMVFKNINVKESKIINIIASSTLGIYLIHDNQYIRSILWDNIFHNNSYYNNNYLFLYEIGVVVIVFLVCLAIELIRKELFKHSEKIIIKTKIFQKIQNLTKTKKQL